MQETAGPENIVYTDVRSQSNDRSQRPAPETAHDQQNNVRELCLYIRTHSSDICISTYHKQLEYSYLEVARIIIRIQCPLYHSE